MSKVVVADTGPLSALALVELLSILPKLFSRIYVPDSVVKEATQNSAKPAAIAITHAIEEKWIECYTVEKDVLYSDLITLLDAGESEALSLAHHLGAIALIDEQQGRRVATHYNISVTATAAVLVKAKNTGLIDAVKPILDSLVGQGYRLSNRLIKEILDICQEQ